MLPANANGGVYLQMSTANNAKYNCLSSLAPTSPSSCQNTGVTMTPGTKKAVWMFVPAKGAQDIDGAYNLIYRDPVLGCDRYLSASSSCTTTKLGLATKDDGSGKQWWILGQA